MSSLSPDLIQAIATNIAKVPANAADLSAVAAAVGSQIEGLAHLRDLGLEAIEPATVFTPPVEARDGEQ